MAKTNFHDVTIDLPEGWANQSVITLVGPAPTSAMPTLKKRFHPARPSVIVRQLHVEEPPFDLAAFAQAQTEMMARLTPELEVAASDTTTIGPAQTPAELREYLVPTPDGPLRQLHLYFTAHDRFYAFCATAADDLNFDEQRSDFLAIAGSIEVG